MSHEIIMPALGMAQDTAVIIAWHKLPGDAVKADDVLMEVETDKATMEVEAGYDGYLIELRAEVDVPVPVGGVIAIIAADAPSASVSDVQIDTPSPSPLTNTKQLQAPANFEANTAQPLDLQESNQTAQVSQGSMAMGARILASPKAQFEARKQGIDLALLVSQGATQPLHMSDLDKFSSSQRSASASPKVRKLAREKEININQLATELGRNQIGRADILNVANAVQSNPPASSDTASMRLMQQFWDIDHSQYGDSELVSLPRAVQFAATNLTAAQQLIPAVTHHDRVRVDELEKIRADLKDDASLRDVRLTALSFHAKALAKTLKAFPRFNASLSVDGTGLSLKKYIDVGIAVDTEHGLKVVVLRGCDGKTLSEIAVDIQDLATRARARKIRPDEMGGAGMSITNLGARGPDFFTPIINPPEVAILGLSRSSIEPVWSNAAFEPCSMTPLSLTYDHRVVNGADAVAFLEFYKEQLLKPWRLLI